MQSLFNPTGNLRQFTAGLLLSIFIALSLVPVGFMPDFSGKKGQIITICSDYDQKDIAVDENGQPVHKKSELPCAFSFHASGNAAQPIIFSALYLTALLHNGIKSDQLFSEAAAYTNGARAPPIL